MPWKERMNWVYGSVVLLTYAGYLGVIAPIVSTGAKEANTESVVASFRLRE